MDGVSPGLDARRSAPLTFLLVVTVLSVPFFVLGAVTDGIRIGSLELPASAVMFTLPVIVAAILVARADGRAAVARLLRRVLLEQMRGNDTFVYLARGVDPAKASAITDEYSEVGAERQSIRNYPGGSLAANLAAAGRLIDGGELLQVHDHGTPDVNSAFRVKDLHDAFVVPQEVAEAVAFLCGPAATSMTGSGNSIRSRMIGADVAQSVSPVVVSLRPARATISPANASSISAREFECICSMRPTRSRLPLVEFSIWSPFLSEPE